MNFKRFFKMMVTDPNSSDGLLIRAEKLDEEYNKTKNESYFYMAEILRELSLKKLTPYENKRWIKENVR